MKHRTNPERTTCAVLVLCLLSSWSTVHGQGLNNLWLGGFDSDGPPPFGGVDLDFQNGSMVITTMSRAIGYRRTSTNITDASGSLLFSTNGSFVANALGDTMLNGTGLSPGWYVDQYPEGLAIPQGVLILPKPEASGVYYLFHTTLDVWATASALHLYLSVIDMSLDGGLGAVVIKNQELIADELNSGKLCAVRHANGRDWWVFTHRLNTDIYYRLLVTPAGVAVDGTQSIGAVHPPDAGQVCFSPDGSSFAYFYEDVEVLPFDRCSGLFSDPILATVGQFDPGRGVAFSPSGRFAYISTVEDVYQFDMDATDIAASMVQIAHWDSTYSPEPPFATLFNIAQLAPDGKIYIGTGNSTDKLHVVHNPDEPGLACNMEQHGIALPRYFSNSLPNHPNYHLGPLAGSPCDTLGLSVPEEMEQVAIRAFPNPSDGRFTLSYPVQATAGLLEVLDLQGRVVYSRRLAAWSQVHTVELENVQAGMYQCKLQWNARRASIRVVVEE